jgi:uncharacterized membrane protein YebE (DUF533 family)
MNSARIVAIALALATVTLAAAPSFADSNRSVVEIEFQNQHDRIERGISSRQITRHEATLLRDEQTKIAQMIARARVDGRIDPYEMREIEKAQAVASKHIYAEKHDREVAEAPSAHRPGYGFWHRPHRWW